MIQRQYLLRPATPSHRGQPIRLRLLVAGVGMAAIIMPGIAIPPAVAAPSAGSSIRLHTDPEGAIGLWLLAGGFRRGRRNRRSHFQRDLLRGEASADPREGQRVSGSRRIRWKLSSGRSVKVNLKRSLRPSRRTVGYAFARILVPTGRDARLLIGSDDGVRAWLNGKLVHDNLAVRGFRWDHDLIPVRLETGTNRLLLKIDQGGGRWAFSARLTDAAGVPMRDLRVELRIRRAGRRLVRKVLRRGLRTRFGVDLRPAGSIGRVRVHLRTGPPELGDPVTVRVRVGTKTHQRRLTWRELAREPLEIPFPLRVRHRVRVRLTLSDDRGVLYRSRFGRTFPRSLRRLAFRAETLLAQADPLRVPQRSIDSTGYVLERGRELLEAGDGDWRYIRKLLREAVHHARLLARGRDPYQRKRQAFYRGYRSRFDGKLQGYATYVPSRYTPRRKWPLVVTLHGFQSTTMITLRRTLGSSITPLSYADGDRRIPRFKEGRFLVAAPRGYGNIAYRYIAEDDLLRVIEEMKRTYNIDENRIYLTGLSMGGLGTMEQGMHYPDRWAGLISNCGAADTRLYESVEGYRPTEWETELINARSAVLWAANGLHLPFYIAHGLRDPINKPRNSRVLVEEYRRLGYRVWGRFDRDLGHNVWDRTWEKGRIWTKFLKFRRDPYPPRVLFTSAHYRYLRSYWVRFEEFEKLWKFARIDARIDTRGNGIVATTRNLLRFSLDVSGPRLSLARPLRIVVDGQTVHEGTWRQPSIRLARAGQTWRVVPPNEVIPPPGKRPGLSGPIEDFKNVRQLLVYGSQDPEEEYTLRRAALEAARYHSHAGIRLAVKRDVDVTPEDLENYHLHLFGTPRSNSWLRKVEKQLPVRLVPGGVAVGGQIHRGPDVGFKLIYPSPLAAGKYLMVSAGVHADAASWANHLPLWTPDYIVYDQKTVSPYGNKILESRPARAAGYFDKSWKLAN